MIKTTCPKCRGVGLIETAIGGHWCRECGGSGFIKQKGVGEASGPTPPKAHSLADGPDSQACQQTQGI